MVGIAAMRSASKVEAKKPSRDEISRLWVSRRRVADCCLVRGVWVGHNGSAMLVLGLKDCFALAHYRDYGFGT